MIRGITLLEKEAIFGGGFADIYKAAYNDKDVALKRMRVFERGQERHKIHQVRFLGLFAMDVYLTCFPIDLL